MDGHPSTNFRWDAKQDRHPLPHRPLPECGTLLNQFPVAAYACDADGLITGYNELAQQLWGQAPALGDPDQRFSGAYRSSSLDGVPLAHDETAMAVTLKTGAEQQAELWVEQPDGTRRRTWIRTNPVYDDSNHLTGAIATLVCPDEFQQHGTANDPTPLSHPAKTDADPADHENDRRFRSIFMQAGVGVGIVDSTTGRFLEVNDKYTELVGYSREEMTGKTWQEITHPEDIPHSRKLNDQVAQGSSRGFTHEKRLVRKDGSTLWVNTTVSPTWNPDENATHQIVIVEDISERKRALEELERNRERFELATAGTSDGLWDWDLQTMQAWCAPRFLQLIGFANESIDDLYQFWESRLHPNDRDATLAAIADHVAPHGNPIDVEYRLLHKDDQYRWFRSRGDSVRDESGKAVRMSGSICDVTATKQTLEELAASNVALEEQTKLFQAILESANDGIVVVDEHGHFIHFNAAAEQMLGLGATDVPFCERAKHYGAFLPDRQTPYPAEELPLRRALRGESIRDCEIYIRNHVKPDGVWCSINAAPLFDQHGMIHGGIATYRDVTAKKQTLEALKQSRRFIEAIATSSPYFIYVIDVESLEVRYFNRSLAAELGYGDDASLPQSITDIVNLMIEGEDQHLEHVVAEWTALSPGEIREDDYFMQCADGSVRTFLGHEVLFSSSPSGSRQILGTTLDITEHREDQRRLRLAEYSIKAAQDAIFWFRPDGSFFYVNDEAIRSTLYSAEELCRMKVSDIDPLAPPEAWPTFWEQVKGQESFLFEQAIRRKDGSQFDVEVRATHILFEEEELGVAFVRDVTQRRAADLALRASETRLRETTERLELAVNGTSDGLWDWDILAQTVWISPKGMEILGYDPHEQTADTSFWMDLVHPDDIPTVQTRLEQHFDKEQDVPYDIEHRIKTVNGNYRWIRSRGRAVRDANGNPIRMSGSYRDVTERKQLRTELETSREESIRLRNKLVEAIESISEGFALYDPDDRLVMCNSRFREIYDISADILVPGAKFEEHIRVSAYRGQVADALGREEEWIRERTAEHQNPQGTYLQQLGNGRWIQVSERPTRNGGIVGVRADITERIQAEQALRESEQRMRLAVDATNLGVWEWDIQTNDVYFSPEWKRQLGYLPDELPNVYETWSGRLHPDDRDRVFETMTKHLVDPQVEYAVEFRLRHKDGSYRSIYTRGEAIRDSTGQPTHVYGCHVDITERKEAEEKRRDLESQLLHAQKLESLGVLAGGIAHDFNNLLTAMLGYSDLSQQELPQDSPALPMIHEIETAARTAAGLTRQMLAYAGKGSIAFEPLQLNSLVKEMVSLLQTAVSRKATVELQLDPARVNGDATQIRQVVMNLVTNASDALQDNVGVIHVRTGTREADANYLHSRFVPDELPPGTYAFVEVRDTGSGMNNQTLNRIFDPFFSTKFTGRGLGLAALLGIVRSHNGTVKVASTPGTGTVIEVLLPNRSDAEKVASPPQQSPARGHGTILVIDDEPRLRQLSDRILKRDGFEVLTAENGRTGLQAFAAHEDQIIAVLLDFTMPEMDGMETLERLRETSQVPVVIMSGHGEGEIADHLSRAGASGFLQKPFAARDLLDRIHEFLDPAADDSPANEIDS